MSDNLSAKDREAELLARLRAGDRTAWPDLLLPTRKLLLPLVRPLAKNEAEAEDLIQDAFLSIITKMETFHETARFSTWAYRVARNKTLNAVREEAQRRKLLQKHEVYVASSTGMSKAPTTPEQALLTRESIDNTQRAFASLRWTDQTVLTRAVEDADRDDGGAAAPTPPADAKERVALHRARQRLHQAILQLEETEDDQ
jgi:RNA polymerase sigma factor (sigma-70 family)